MASLRTGVMQLRAPDGKVLKMRLDRYEEHPSGDWTWVGDVEGVDPQQQQAVITFGRDAVFGSIPQPAAGSVPLQLSTRHRVAMMGNSSVEALGRQGKQLGRIDYRIPDITEINRERASPRRAVPVTAAKAPVHHLPTVDLMVAYTQGVAQKYGSPSALVTRLNFKTDETNAAFVRSGVQGRIRLVHTAMASGYPDLNPNSLALDDLTSGGGAALQPFRSTLRDQHGADLVMLFKDYTPNDTSCGIAWLNGYAQNDISLYQMYGFSVVNDDPPCWNVTFAHELGHNLGQDHDRIASAGSLGGAHDFSWGYETSLPDGVGFTTIMAYPRTGPYTFLFSSPYKYVKGVRAGTTGDNNVASLNLTFPGVATFRDATVSQGVRARNDVTGDDRTDLLFHNAGASRFEFWQMSSSTIVASPPASATPAGGRLLASGDFDGNGRTDLLWQDASRKLWLWTWQPGSTTWDKQLLQTAGLTAATSIVGAADLDGDGRDELLLTSLNNTFSYWKLAGIVPVRGRAYTIPPGATLAATGDLNLDGKQDLVWMAASRQLYVWWSNGGDLSNMKFAYANIDRPLAPGTEVVSTTDINNDGKGDLLFFNAATGDASYWLMNRNLVSARSGPIPVGPGAVFGGAGDFNGDDRADAVWQVGDRLLMWFGNGTLYPWQARTLARSQTSGWQVHAGGVGG